MLASVTKLCGHPNLKTLSLNQTLQRLPMTLAQVKAGHTSENLQKEIKQIIYSFYRKRNFKRNYQKNTQQYNEFRKVIKTTGYYIHGF